MSSHDYPELEAIPPAPPRSNLVRTGARSSPLVPKWAAALFSAFPIHTFPAAKAYSPATSTPPVKPTLYVAPHLNRDGTLATEHDRMAFHSDVVQEEKPSSQQSAGWTSSDPVALRWQMELLFSEVDFEVRFIDPSHNWGPAKSMPFLHLPPHFRSTSDAIKAIHRSSLLTAVEIPHLLDNSYPSFRPELGEKASQAWQDDATELEARSWVNLLKGRVMAGVLLAVLLSPQSAAYMQNNAQSYLSSLLSAQLQTSFFDQQLRRISALNPSSSMDTGSPSRTAHPTTSLPGWEVAFLGWIGATTASAASTLSSGDLDSRGGGDTPGAALASPSVDQEKVVLDAVAGLRAIAARTKAHLEGSVSELQFLLGANKPTSLDALAFSVIHTLLTLAATPQSQTTLGNEPLRRLKEVLDESPWLVSWSRTLWKAYVRDLDRAGP